MARKYAAVLKILITAILLLSVAARADVRLPQLLGDGVVLQRDTSVTIWGWADDSEVIEVRLDGELVASTTTKDGQWRVALAAQTAGGPHQLQVSGNNSLQISDVYFGDVWIASGQSNMQLPMERVKEKYESEIATANYPLIREFEVPRRAEYQHPQRDLDGGTWKRTTPDSVLSFSAVGYFFARSLQSQYDVPIGIISSNYGGSAAESWMSEKALADYPHYLDIARRNADEAALQQLLDRDKAVVDAWYADVDSRDAGLSAEPGWAASDYDDSDWPEMDLPGFWDRTELGPINGVVWFRKTIELPSSANNAAAKLMLGRIVDADTTYINGMQVGNTTYQYPPRRYEVPAGLLRAGKNTIAVRVVNSSGSGGFVTDKPYWLQFGDSIVDLRGAWRYKLGATAVPIAPPDFVGHRQPLGFSNAMLEPLLNMTIKGVIWYQGETNVDRPAEYVQLLPAMIRDWRERFGQGNFPFILVQLANFLEAQALPGESAWAETRNAQLLALREPNTAMAVAIDIGEWNDIHPLDKKTVGERLALAARKLAYGETNLVASGPIFRSLELCGDGIAVEFDFTGDGLVARGPELNGFAVAGADDVFHWADAHIDGDTVIVKSAAVPHPKRVRYAWADNPSTANLYNREGLPASPFEAAVED
jgi:sialate O-acetylesterase